jgi:hypothetical protein
MTTQTTRICPVTAGLVDLDAYAAVDGGWRVLGISAPARRALIDAGYTHVDQLAGVSRRSLAKLHGMGPKALRLLSDALEQNGYRFDE